MPDLETSGTFFLTAILLGLAPGPDIIFVLVQSALFGARAGVITTFGLATGLCFQTAAVALGIAAIVLTYPLAFNLLRGAGALYLCWLAYLAFRARPDKADTSKEGNFSGYATLYKRGVIMNVTNPKVAIFFLAFLPQFCDPSRGNMAMQIIYLGLLFILATLLVFCSVALLGGKLASLFNNSPRIQLFINRLAGMVFVCLAMALILLN